MFDFSNPLWLVVGFVGQALFGSRFIIQWIYSEYKKESVIPVSFWWLSIAGSLLLCVYAIKQKDIVFTLGFSLNIFIYIRNLMLIHKKK